MSGSRDMRQLSRDGWTTESRTLEAINCGSILRIADALESKAEPVAIPADVAQAAKSMRDNDYRGPLAWARKVIDFVAEHDAAPVQPEKAERKPLSDEQAKTLLRHSDLLDMFLHIGWYSAPRKHFDINGLALIREIERAHGIGSSTEGGGNEL